MKSFTHVFITLADQKIITRIDLSRVESLQYSGDETEMMLNFIGATAPMKILCTPESLAKLVAAWEKVRGKIIRLV